MRTVLPMISFSSPKNFLAVLSVITIACNWEKATLGLPCTNGNENMLKNEGSAYLPDALTALSPMVHKREISHSVVRQVFAIPAREVCIASDIGPAVEECVKTPSSTLSFVLTINSRSFFKLLLSKSTSSWTHKKINPAQAMPMANPKILRKLYPLFFKRFRVLVVKKFFIIS